MNFAEKRRAEIEQVYRGQGIAIAVPELAVSDSEFNRRAKAVQVPFYLPGWGEATYEQIMAAFGQGGHWTVTDGAARAEIGWESAEVGYWLWLEVAERCPRLGTSWNDLTTTAIPRPARLVSLGEYAPAWHLHRAITSEMLDVTTWCWLRTRFGRGALVATEFGGELGVYRRAAEALAIPCGTRGGRAAEVVKVRPAP